MSTDAFTPLLGSLRGQLDRASARAIAIADRAGLRVGDQVRVIMQDATLGGLTGTIMKMRRNGAVLVTLENRTVQHAFREQDLEKLDSGA